MRALDDPKGWVEAIVTALAVKYLQGEDPGLLNAGGRVAA